jgi:excisionase family DNA binding protein
MMKDTEGTSRLLLDVQDLADVLRVSRTAVYRLVERRMIPFHRIPAGLRFHVRDVEAFLAKSRVGGVADHHGRAKD